MISISNALQAERKGLCIQSTQQLWMKDHNLIGDQKRDNAWTEQKRNEV